MQRQISLLQQFVHACCGITSPSEQMVSDLMAPTLSEPQRLLGAVVGAAPSHEYGRVSSFLCVRNARCALMPSHRSSFGDS